MCFSPEASFTASGLLVSGGAFALNRARTLNPRLTLLTIFPLGFGLQQAAEGVVWLRLQEGQTAAAMPYSLAFLFFSHCFWLVWSPLCAWRMESDYTRKRIIGYFFFLGVLMGLLLYLPLLVYDWVKPEIVHQHITYDVRVIFDLLIGKGITRAVYITLILAPMFLSSVIALKILGVLVLASMVLTYMNYFSTFVSVWCFFAAVISGYLIFWNELEIRRTTSPRSSPAAPEQQLHGRRSCP